MPVRCILFDFGNTLFGHDDLQSTLSACSARLDRPLAPAQAAQLAADIEAAAHTPDELMHRRDLDAAVWAARWEVLYGLGDDLVPGLGSAVMHDMHDPQRWVPYAQTNSTLRELHRAGLAIGVVSNTGWDIRPVFRCWGVDDCIDEFTLSYEAGLVKPDPAMFEQACRRLGADPAITLMVGDDPIADSGAVAAGLQVLLLPRCSPGRDNGVVSALRLGAVEPTVLRSGTSDG